MKTLATLLLCAALPVHAQLTTTCGADARFRLDGLTTQTGTGSNNGLSCFSLLGVGGIGVATANAEIGQGFLKVDAHVDTMSQPADIFPWQTAHARASARTLDRIVISAPGKANQLGLMTFSVSLSGLLTSSVRPDTENENRGYWSLAAGLSPTFFNNPDQGVFLSIDPSWSASSRMPLRGEFQESWNITVTGRSAFRFNTETQLIMDLQLYTDALFTGGTVDGYFGNSAYWGGIVSIQDANGVELDLATGPAQAGQYTMSTQSGFDWHPSQVPSPVPEPSAAWLMLLGLPLLARRVAFGAPLRGGAEGAAVDSLNPLACAGRPGSRSRPCRWS